MKSLISNATEFLLSIRKAYLHSRMFEPEYVTFYVSSKMFKDYTEETKTNAKVYDPNNIPWIEKFFLRQIRVREDPMLRDQGIRIKEGRKDWEEN